MDLEIITTIAYHPRGADLHLRNLRWAFPDAKITVFAFADNYILNADQLITVPKGKTLYYDFHNHFLGEVLRNSVAKCILLMQQDIVFIRRDIVYSNITMDSSLVEEMKYLAVFDLNKRLVQPRYWEGAIFYPRELLLNAFDDNVSLGCRLKYFTKERIEQHRHILTNRLYRIPFTTDRYMSIYDYLINTPSGVLVSDKLSELTLYGMINEFPFNISKEYAVHFQGPEKIHRQCPDIYDNIHLLKNHPTSLANNAALLYYLSGAVQFSEELLKQLRRGNLKQLTRKLFKLKLASEWMSSDQFERLNKVIRYFVN